MNGTSTFGNLISFLACAKPDGALLRTIAHSCGKRLPTDPLQTEMKALALATSDHCFAFNILKASTLLIEQSGGSTASMSTGWIARIAWRLHPVWSGDNGLQSLLEVYAKDNKAARAILTKVAGQKTNAARRKFMEELESRAASEFELEGRKWLASALEDIAQPLITLVITALVASGEEGEEEEEGSSAENESSLSSSLLQEAESVITFPSLSSSLLQEAESVITFPSSSSSSSSEPSFYSFSSRQQPAGSISAAEQPTASLSSETQKAVDFSELKNIVDSNNDVLKRITELQERLENQEINQQAMASRIS